MLILTRKRNEKILIGDNGEVQLGIDAPNETPIHREEVFTSIIKENNKNKSLANRNTK